MGEGSASIGLRSRYNSPTDGVGNQDHLAEALDSIAKGNVAAFPGLYMATKAKIAKTCFMICGDREVAEDLTADVYAVVLQKASQWDRSRGSAIAWICSIARNKAIDWHRARRSTEWVDLQYIGLLPDEQPCYSDTLQRYQEIALAVSALAVLSDDQRVAITAAFFEERTYSSLAKELGIPLGTLKARIRRGLAALRASLSEP